MKRRHRRTGRPASSTFVDGAAPLPDDFARLAHEWLGDEAAAFLAACSRQPWLAIRANALKGGLPALLLALDADAAMWPHVPWWPAALLPPPEEATSLASGRAARIGALYAQDAAALAAVATLDPRPGERVLDLCAAPGGKSSAIADQLAGQGLLVSNDIVAGRARELRFTLERWGAANAAVFSLPPARLAELAPGFFDRVLVDAPCSGEAMFARRAGAVRDWTPQHVAGCAARQRHILARARRLVRPGGIMVYATCTFNPSENEDVIAAYLAMYPGDTLDDASAYVPGASPGRPDLLAASPVNGGLNDIVRCARLWPHLVSGAGHFVARLRIAAHDPAGIAAKHNVAGTAADAPPESRMARRAVAATDESALVCATMAAAAPGFSLDGRVVVRGDSAFLAPVELPPALEDVALAPGLHVAERRGRTWRPAHALAMALHPDQAAATVRVDETGAALFLAGQPIPGFGAGVVLAAWRGYPLGWARARAGTLTPLLPAGLRAPGGITSVL